MRDPIAEIRQALGAVSDEQARKSAQTFFKEAVKTYGVKVPVARAIAKPIIREIKTAGKQEVFGLCEQLWSSGYLEESIIACDLSLSQKKRFVPADFATFTHWIRNYVNNWASCDTLCNHTVGEFLLLFPDFVDKLKPWTRDDNRWVRRAAAVSLIVPARRGKFLAEILGIARLELEDTDDLVQKGYGWMLKSAADAHLQEVFDFVMAHKERMPRTALRYAVEKMPMELKKQAMQN